MTELYAVYLKSRNDLDGFYSDMKSDGFKLAVKREWSLGTIYHMTEAQAVELRKDSRVQECELADQPKELLSTKSWPEVNQTTHIFGMEHRKSGGEGTGFERDWGKVHCSGDDADKRPSPLFPLELTVIAESGKYNINGVGNNPDVELSRGSTYTFNVNAVGHPFWIKTVAGTGSSNAYTNGVANNGNENGAIVFNVPSDAPNTLYYNCEYHSGMVGTITITDAPATGQGWYENGALTPVINDPMRKIFGDGRHVDLVICDTDIAFDAQDWVNRYSESWDTDGTVIPIGQSRFHQYDWFNELNQYVGALDDDGITIPNGSYTDYPTASGSTGRHGTHVMSTAGGMRWGWANKANLYNINVFGDAQSNGGAGEMPSYLLFDYIRAFHFNKPINKVTGRRNPTVCNHSWGFIYNWGNYTDYYLYVTDLTQVVWRGVTYNSSNPNPSGWTNAGIAADFGISTGYYQYSLPRRTSHYLDVQQLIDDGICHIGAAGNDHRYYVSEIDPTTGQQSVDWNNKMTIDYGYGDVYLCRPGSPNGAHQDANGLGGQGRSAISVGALSNYSDMTKADFSNFGPTTTTFAPGENVIAASTSQHYGYNNPVDPNYGGDNWYESMGGTSMASPQVAGMAACLATNKPRFTNSDLLGFIQNYDRYDFMNHSLYPQNRYLIQVEFGQPNGTSDYVVEGDPTTDAGGNNLHAQQDPTIIVEVGDRLELSGIYKTLFLQCSSAVANSHYVVNYTDHSNLYALPYFTAGATNPTINIEVGDRLTIDNNASSAMYVKDAPTTGYNTDLTTDGVFRLGESISQNEFYQNWASRSWTPATPGTYYYQDRDDQSLGGQIIVHARGTYYNHPTYIRTTSSISSNPPTGGAITGQGTQYINDTRLVWDTDGAIPGTYYYVHGQNGSMWGMIKLSSKQGVLGQAGNFDDPSCMTNTTNRMMSAVNPRAGKVLQNGWNKSALKGHRRGDETNIGRQVQLYPRTNSLYTSNTTTGMQYTYSVGAASGKYVMTGTDRLDSAAAKDNPTIHIKVGDIILFDLKTSVSGHPFWVGISQQTGQVTWGNAMGTITNNGATSGTITWDTTNALPGTYYYNCEYHGTMTGTIFVNE